MSVKLNRAYEPPAINNFSQEKPAEIHINPNPSLGPVGLDPINSRRHPGFGHVFDSVPDATGDSSDDTSDETDCDDNGDEDGSCELNSLNVKLN